MSTKRRQVKSSIKIIIIIFVMLILRNIYNWYLVKTAKVKVTLVDSLDVEVYSSLKAKDLVKKINGKIIDNSLINTNKLGKQEVKLRFINEDNITVPYSFEINVVDTTPPMIFKGSVYTVNVNFDKDIEKEILCVDNYDDKPKCKLSGDYDLKDPGDYLVNFKASDKNGNTVSRNFTLRVVESNTNKIKVNDEELKPSDEKRVLSGKKIKDIKKKYKDGKIGIDISRWQGEIDFKKVKKSGVEFAMIRVGYQGKETKKYNIDPMFKKYIKGLNEVDIPVGVYFFSYASSKKEALDQAKWVHKKIKDYKIELPVVFDWEDWSNLNKYKLSFYHLTTVADTFLDYFKDKGYDTMLYSSKYYLDNIWLEKKHDIWLAHYVDKTDYDGDYKMWQICEDGIVPGINNNVDINIMYD